MDEKKAIKPAENDRSRNLISLLGVSLQNHKSSADPHIVEAISKLICLIKSHEIAIADKNDSGTVWNRKSILESIGEVFDPPLKALIPTGSLAWTALDQRGTPLPLANQLRSKNNLLSIADNLKTAAQILEEYFDPQTDDWDKMVCQGESLNAVADVVDAVRIALPNLLPEWCGVCFRRAYLDRKYCALHTPGRLSTKDTTHRKAKRLMSVLPVETVKAWKSYMSERKALGESVELISSPEDVPTSFSVHSRIIWVLPVVKKLVEKTHCEPWSLVSAEWEQLFTVDFPNVSSILERRPVEFQKWEEFAAQIPKVLKDPYENTMHPFWILNILACAEEWLIANQGNRDGRLTDTAKMIVELFKSGVTDPKEVATRVGKSKQYVYRIIKENQL